MSEELDKKVDDIPTQVIDYIKSGVIKDYESKIKSHIEREKLLSKAVISLSDSRNELISSIDKIGRESLKDTKILNSEVLTPELVKILQELGLIQQKQ